MTLTPGTRLGPYEMSLPPRQAARLRSHLSLASYGEVSP